MAALAGFAGDLLITSPPSINLSANEAFTNSGDNKTYTITSALHRYLDRSVTPTVQTQTNGDGVTWATVAASTYTIRYQSAQIVHNNALVGGTQATRILGGTANYFAYASLASVSEWDGDLKVDMHDITTLKGVGGSPWKDFTPLLLGATFKCKKYWLATDAQTIVGYFTGRTLLIVSLVVPDGHRWEGYCYLKDCNLKSAVSGIVEKDLTFDMDNTVVYV
jgi:hypothetical protein